MADFKEPSPMAEDLELRPPRRDPSLDDFEKLENYIIQDKNAEVPVATDLLGDNELLGLSDKSKPVDNDFKPSKKDEENNFGQDLLGDFNCNSDLTAKPDYSRAYNEAPPSYEQSSADLSSGETAAAAFDSDLETSHLPRYTQEAYENTVVRPSERLLQFDEPAAKKPSGLLEDYSSGLISDVAEKLVHPPSDSGYDPSPAEENAEVKDKLGYEGEAEKPGALKIAPSFVDSLESHSEKPEPVEARVETKNSTPIEPVDSYKPKKSTMSTEVSSSKPADVAGCPFSPSALFDPNRLHPGVTSLVYWHDPKKSGIVFGVSLLFLISLRYFSFISVVSYLALGIIGATLSFRIYKNILQAVQKSSDGHPFKEYLEIDISIPQEKIHESADVIVGHAISTIVRLRSVFLVEDLVDSIKLGIVLWCLTYVGGWFNGLTLITLGFIAVFSLPKVYETNKAQIDQYLNLVNSHVGGVIATVKSKIPFGNKEKTQ